MRILIANDGASDAGGVQSYLDSVVIELQARGHELALAYCTDSGLADSGSALQQLPRFHLASAGSAAAFDAIQRWAPDVCFAHNMHDLAIEARVAALAPIVKFMHGYFGTCISAIKMHGFPSAQPCARSFGPACVALFLPRRCGQLSPVVLLDQLRWARAQRAQFARYRTIVVASEHMRREYLASGLPADRVIVNPLFVTSTGGRPAVPALESTPPTAPRVGFLGRMTALKGGDLLVQAAAFASSVLGRPVSLLMIGDGPCRPEWEALAARLRVPCTFPGWVNGDARWDLLRDCSLVAMPSLWPEPFGLVGLEAKSLGIPAVAPDHGGVREWLVDGLNGAVAPTPVTPESFGHTLARLLADDAGLRRWRLGALRMASELTVARHVDRLEPLLRPARPEAVAC